MKRIILKKSLSIKLRKITWLILFCFVSRLEAQSPLELCTNDQTLYIITSVPNGYQLWKRINQCFFLVKEFIAGEIYSLTKSNGLVYFVFNDPAYGRELWRSDGTREGTLMVKNINQKVGGNGNPLHLTDVNGILFFTAYDGTYRALWKTDGTDAGTVMVKDGSIWSTEYGEALTELTEVNGKLFFSFFTSYTGQTELWKSDGTDVGTVKIKAFPGGALTVQHITNANGSIYFSALQTSTGFELWRSDGSGAGTILYKDIVPGQPAVTQLT